MSMYNRLIVPLMVGIVCGIGERGAVFAEEPTSRPSSIEIVVNGRVFPSITEYRHFKRPKPVHILPSARVPLAGKPVSQVPVDLVCTVPKSANTEEQSLARKAGNELRSGIDDNGWKTVWLDGAPPAGTQSQVAGEAASVTKEEAERPVLPIEVALAEQDMPIQRILGVSPSMTALVQDFEQLAVVPYIGSQMIKVGTSDELGQKIRQMAAGSEGPFLIQSSHNRIRLMGLKAQSDADSHQ